MAKMKFPTLKEFAEKAAEMALNEFFLDGYTIREWAEKISK